MGHENYNISTFGKDPQKPLAVSVDSVYASDIWTEESTSDGFSGEVVDLFNSLHTVLENTAATNPKEIFIHFHRTIFANFIGFGAFTGDFSNTKIELIGSGGAVKQTVDFSADSTKQTSQKYNVRPDGMNAMRIQFHTADPVTLSNITIQKAIQTTAKIQATSELTGNVEDVASFRNALKVDTALVHREGVNLFFFRETGVGSTLAVAASEGDTSVTVVDATGFVIGNKFRLTSTVTTGQPFLVITNIAVNESL